MLVMTPKNDASLSLVSNLFTLALVSLMFLAGYTEKLFGIGDIKGIHRRIR